jgi:hypothetical protein
VREGSGWGYASGVNPSEVHERALKVAETDATKRALATFGNRFGLCLYDRARAGLTSPDDNDTLASAVIAGPGDDSPGSEGWTSEPEAAAVNRPNAQSGSSAPIDSYSGHLNGSTAAGGLSDGRASLSSGGRNSFVLLASTGTVIASGLSPEAFCSGLRQLIEACSSGHALQQLDDQNRDMVEKLRREEPQLISARNVHYADLLRHMVERRRMGLAAVRLKSGPPMRDTRPYRYMRSLRRRWPSRENTMPPQSWPTGRLLPRPSRISNGPAVDKSVLRYGAIARVRDKGHLRYVASKPCLICEAIPSHAHHLRFTQPRGMSLKVSDEFTVPLCVVHHNELHRPGTDERAWWHGKGIEPLDHARALWAEGSSDGAVTVDLEPSDRET